MLTSAGDERDPRVAPRDTCRDVWLRPVLPDWPEPVNRSRRNKIGQHDEVCAARLAVQLRDAHSEERDQLHGPMEWIRDGWAAVQRQGRPRLAGNSGHQHTATGPAGAVELGEPLDPRVGL